ncbi:MAG: RDD family protein [Planctomycetota bacterium]|nr:RDD family protein [Planctomycetota bacterium]
MNGTPYLLVENAPIVNSDESDARGMFYVYKPADPADAAYGAWQTAVDGRAGPVFGTFAWSDGQGQALGALHRHGATLFRFAGPEPPKSEIVQFPFEWIAETGVQLGDKLYLFGGEFPRRSPQEQQKGPPVGKVAVAEYDGKSVAPMEIETPPEILSGPNGFWLKAVYFQGKIQLFWRGAEESGTLDLEPSLTFSGPLKAVTFDGKGFGPVRTIANLPRGITTVWSDGDRLRAAVQAPDPSFGKTASPRVFTLGEDGEPAEDPLPERDAPGRLSFKFCTLDHIPAEGADAFLRSNSQIFEVWRAGPEGWSVQPRPRGLIENGLERLLFVAFGVSVGIVAMGLGLAFRRRRQLALVVQKLKPGDVLAPLSLRISAHLIDLGLVAVAAEVYAYAAGVSSQGLVNNLVEIDIRTPYFQIYLMYLVLGEWAGGATVGKLAMGLRVVTDKGDRITLWSALVRNLVGYFERNPLFVPFLSLPTILFTPSSQRLGDMLARTLVVQKAAMERFRSQRETEAAQKAEAEAEPPPPEPPAPKKEDAPEPEAAPEGEPGPGGAA